MKKECIDDSNGDDLLKNFNQPSDKALLDLQDKYNKTKTFEEAFELLWKFIAQRDYRAQHYSKKTNKTIDDSTRWRTIGNKEYTNLKNKDNISKSIEAYTKSIAHAPVGSSELSLAYANRSAVLFRARLYDDCLLDIERSLKSGYPDNLKTKLFLRQSLCFKSLKPNSELETNISMASAMQWLPNLKKNNPHYNIKDEYSMMINQLEKPRDTNTVKFTPIIKINNSIIAGGSDAIKLKKTNENKQYIIATRDIKCGEFIYSNKPFETIVCDDYHYIYCWHCCRQTWAGIPCDDCSNIIFCSPECKNIAWNEYHDLECPVLRLVETDLNVKDKLAVKILIKSIKAAGGIAQLKKKITDLRLIKDKSMIYTDDVFDVNTIDNFHRLYYHKSTLDEYSLKRVLGIVEIVLKLGLERTVFDKSKTIFVHKYSRQYATMLGSLLFRYLMIVHSNIVDYTGAASKDDSSTHAIIMPIVKMFEANCDPHVSWYKYEPNVTILAQRPIKKGEKIRISPVGRYQDVPLFQRQSRLEAMHHHPCKCSACVQNLPLMKNLPSYKSLTLSNQVQDELDRIMVKSDGYFELICKKDIEKLLELKDILAEIIDKFYQHVTVPCKEASSFPLLFEILHHELSIPHRII